VPVSGDVGIFVRSFVFPDIVSWRSLSLTKHPGRHRPETESGVETKLRVPRY